MYDDKTFVGGEMQNGKWMRQGDFKAVAVAAPYGSGEWKLFDIRNDPGETNNLAQTRPELLKKLKKMRIQTRSEL